jgi:hypothetical protein
LSGLLRANWDTIGSKTAVQTSELDRARDIGEQIIAAVGTREQAPVLTAAQAQQRQRNFTLFANAYDQVRRAISYLRWNEDDIDDIAPSLYAGRGTGRKKPDAPQPTPAPSPAPSPVVNPAPAPVAAAATHTAAASSPVALPSGMPSANPFAAAK